ncbi:glutathione binding-like protein [Phenylobacterium sp. J426]|uniref:glutathione binding-like protein n=1 Tax=Phenylobacterium sp. J426 TaxID=2898439 RepID=UPI002150EAF7|nr:glutathione binding-like protein [Phenylobacterium sp. J426]MCR5874027.1 glutathione binding-like protein [Phenylobacterium sp. J426]
MDVYYSPLACSLASRIALYEAGAEPRFHRVDTRSGRTAGGEDYRTINPKGLVPAIRTPEGEILTENAAVLQYIADAYPQAQLAPAGFQRYRLQQWLNFIASELHKFVFTPLLSPRFDDAAKMVAREAGAERFAYLDEHLAGREWLLDEFSVADAYLAAVLNWAQAVQFDLDAYPAVIAYRDRLRARPAVARALGEEFAEYRQAA